MRSAAATVRLTGRKEEQKIYRQHSGYEGGLREERAKVVRAKKPVKLVEDAVPERPDEVWTLAYEGGHQDHDACHLGALAFAVPRGVPSFEMPLYHGYGLPGPFFNALAPLRNGGAWSSRKIALVPGVSTTLMSCRNATGALTTSAPEASIIRPGASP